MDTRSSERDLDHPSEKGRVAGDRRHQESPDREAPIGELEAIGISGILGYGSGHLDQGLVKGLARKAHRQSENRESRGHKHCVIVNAETPMEGLATVAQRQVIWTMF
jgi:hypothetical protein